MSVVTLQLGQYGNQMGIDFFNMMSSELSLYPQNHWNSFFRASKDGKKYSRSVLVDMEEKVVLRSIEESKKSPFWKYDSNNKFVKESGAGNSWAYGYARLAPSVCDGIIDILRREIEQCSLLDGVLVFHSLAGGTGSGVGTFITECLQDEFQPSSIINQVAWPFTAGDVAVQDFNSILSLAHLIQCSDAIIVSENEILRDICTKLLKITNPTFFDLNRVIASGLAAVFLPSLSTSNITDLPNILCSSSSSPSSASSSSKSLLSSSFTRPSYLTPFHTSDLLQSLCGHPQFKLLTVRSVPQVPQNAMKFTSDSWPALLNPLYSMLALNTATSERVASRHTAPPCLSIANQLILRGVQHQPCRAADFYSALAAFLPASSIPAFFPPPSISPSSPSSPSSSFSFPSSPSHTQPQLSSMLLSSAAAASSLYVDWSPSPLTVCVSPVHFQQHQTYTAALTNSQALLRPLQQIIEKAEAKASAGAFVHHYAKHGVDAADRKSVV